MILHPMYDINANIHGINKYPICFAYIKSEARIPNIVCKLLVFKMIGVSI